MLHVILKFMRACSFAALLVLAAEDGPSTLVAERL